MVYLLLAIALSAAQAMDAVGSSIEQAQQLAIKKNRTEACALLGRARSAPGLTPKAKARLTDSLHQISKMFFTDKGQKAFEAAQSVMWDNQEMALTQLRNALALEDGNLQVRNALARVQIARADCDGALATLGAARALNPADAEAALLEMRTLVCLQRFDALKERMKQLPALDSWQENYSRYLQALDAQRLSESEKVFELAAQVAEAEPTFPEAHWLLARRAEDGEAHLQRYVSLCKALTARERKRFALEPKLCTHLKEAEDELAKLQTNI